ncbi:hypothetical protein [Nitrospira sp. BLG_1]|uniref:hypothetical protein n=1 Tax=Nitrospira sp. BLG_1 TaxID=3395883 RepID=UPI0039BCDCAF
MRGAKYSSSVGVYQEGSFRNLVLGESKRSERLGHLCRVLLVYRTNPQGLVIPLGDVLADKAISLLSRNCRDTDYVGWYRQGRIVGILMTTLQRDSAVHGCKTLQARLLDRLSGVFSPTNVHSLQMHGLDPGELTTFNPLNYPPSCPVSENQAL